MQKIRPSQWLVDEESGEVVIQGFSEMPDDYPDPINWAPTEGVEIRFPATIQFASLIRSTDPEIPE